MSNLSILYIGSLNPSSNSFRRYKTLENMGYSMIGINTDEYIYKGSFIKFHHHLNRGPGIKALNRSVIGQINKYPVNMIWIDNKSYLNGSTIKKIKSKCPDTKLLIVVTDDITGKLKYQWRLTLQNAKYFDCIFVQREVNIRELKALGAQKVELCYRSYDPAFHRPIQLKAADSIKYTTDVGFIGTYEEYREDYIVYLIKNNIPVSVTGDNWPAGKQWNIIKPFYKGPSVYGEDYIKSLNGMAIALHFLRHANRDEQDSRTFEIPACGTFMLAERSHLHLNLFRENEEAVFFESKEELLEKVKYYLINKEIRQIIAQAGLDASIQKKYSHECRLEMVINKINGY